MGSWMSAVVVTVAYSDVGCTSTPCAVAGANILHRSKHGAREQRRGFCAEGVFKVLFVCLASVPFVVVVVVVRQPRILCEG